MRVLFLCHYFPPEVNAPANRTFEHCRAWAAAGHDVHVVTCVPSHPAGVPFPGYRRTWYHRELVDAVHVHRVWTYLAPNQGVTKRTLNYLSFVPTAVLRSLRLGRFDVVVGTSPQFFCALAACVAAALTRTPFVFELRDLWPESIAAVGALQPSLALRMLESIELWMYRRAVAVVCVTKSFIQNLERRGIEPAKLHYVPNGVDQAFWARGSREIGRATLGVAADQIAVAYIGTIGMAHGLGTVLDAARLLDTDRRLKFFIVGDGAELGALRDRVAASGPSNVTFTGLLPRDAIASVMAAADVALVTLKPSDTFKTVLPSKMLEAMSARKPVVLAVDGEAKAVLSQAGGGLAVTPGDAAALAQAISSLAADADLRARLGSSGGDYAAREFSRAVWAERYLRLLDTLQPTG